MTVTPYQQQLPAGYVQQGNGLAVPARRVQQGLCSLFQGWQKQGKSSAADSGPRPVLCLDVEVASFWTPSRKIYWDPLRETVPVADGSWDTCVVVVQDYQVLHGTLKILNTGQHPFNSISVDSVPTILDRVMMQLAGFRKMERDHWGQLLRHVMAVIWGYRDMLTHPTNPVWAVTFVAGTHWDDRTKKFRPRLSGQSADLVPYVPDITGWVEAYPDGTHHLWIGRSPHHETGNRLWGRLPDDMQLGYPNVVPGWTVESMVERVLASR